MVGFAELKGIGGKVSGNTTCSAARAMQPIFIS